MALTKIRTGSVSDSITLTTPDINGGTIDATLIGGTTPAAATFTTASDASGNVRSGRKNFIINGNLAIAQRGTSSTANGFVSLDRWYVNQSGGSTTFTQETNTSPTQTGGIKSYARLNVSSSSDYTGILQKIEDVTSVPAGTVTLSFYAKGTAPVGGLYVYFGQDFGTGGSADVDINGVLVTSSLTSSWVKYSTQITIPSVDGKTINSGSFLQLKIFQGSNTSSTAYDLNITGIQLEVGSVATSFEHRSYGEELALCQRYFHLGSLAGFMGGYTANNQIGGPWNFPVTMRAVPTVTFASLAGDPNFSGVAFPNGVSEGAMRVLGSFTGLGDNINGYLDGTYEADAEL